MSKKLFLSVGAMKAGTTWLYDKLMHHPEVYFSPEKELHFFAHKYGVEEPLSKEARKRRALGALMRLAEQPIRPRTRAQIAWYLDYATGEVDDGWFNNLMREGRKNEQFLSDFSNLTCFVPRSGWRQIQNNYDVVKAIYIMRDPIKRVWSHYKFHLQFAGHADWQNPTIDFNLYRSLLEKEFFIKNSRYASNLERLRGGLAQESFKVMYFEDMVASPDRFLSDIEAFVGLSAHKYPEEKLKEKTNASIEAPMPDAWYQYTRDLLADEIAELKRLDVWHSEWVD